MAKGILQLDFRVPISWPSHRELSTWNLLDYNSYIQAGLSVAEKRSESKEILVAGEAL